jgi:hypothetical protein
MPRFDTEKLIWQKQSPVMFESAWCLFVKLLSFNPITPKQLAKLIAKKDNPVDSLEYWRSTWIDFTKFSELLDVDPIRLKTGYLDQLKVFTSDELNYGLVTGIKFCPECIQKGYHCIFFQMGFIESCPWHHVKLEAPCFTCAEMLRKTGLKEVKQSGGSIHKSQCGHVLFNESQIPSLNMFSEAEEAIVNKYCAEFLHWWDRVSKCIDVWKFLSQSKFIRDDLDNLPKYLSAAESIAGSCPWPLSTSIAGIRTMCWKQKMPEPTDSNSESVEPFDDQVPRKSEVDIFYRAIRRYLFRRFIKPHRNCWQELSNYSYLNSQDMSSDKACIVTMAFIAWRLSIENFLNLEVLKIGKFHDRPIIEFRLTHEEYMKTVQGQISLMYAHFFYIWEYILRLSGDEKYAITLSTFRGDKSDFAVSYNFEEWLLIMPNYKMLEIQSFIKCCGLKKYSGWMLSPGYVSQWFLEKNAEYSWDNGLMFKLHKDRKRGGYKYVQV